MSSSTPPLACSVRDCGLLLERHGSSWSCARGHTFDAARRGYLNLLQPTDRRSLTAGDSKEAVEARQRVLAAGGGASLLRAIAGRAVPLAEPGAVVVDLGCGSGELLAEVARQTSCMALGIDLSTPAIAAAARRYPSMTWVVANADRRLPLLDRSVEVILSVHGRRNPAECARVLTRHGHLIVAVPGADDLIEVRSAVQGRGTARARGETLRAEHAEYFDLREHFESRERHRLSSGILRDLLRGTYRGARHSAAAAVAALEELEALDVTFASDVFVFTRTGAGGKRR